MNVAIVTLSTEGAIVGGKIAAEVADCRLFVHNSVKCEMKCAIATERFDSIVALTQELFRRCRKLVYVAPCGVVVRAIAPLLCGKTSDPAVVVVDAGGRYAISLLSGHEGGANALAVEVANVLGAEPVISTTTEAVKNLIVGIGCRRGATAERIMAAIRAALGKVGAAQDQVRFLSSASIKCGEAGLLRAADELGLSLRFISCEEILSTTKRFQTSQFVAEKVKLPAVAEPSALLAGRRTQLILPKTIINGVTVAIARENCS
ncbi:MAG TPA: cobalamin biosynthesis protein [Terriglobales bacterium]|nr:cobalamin biosynthesis protein [Terriglobales bacterium]